MANQGTKNSLTRSSRTPRGSCQLLLCTQLKAVKTKRSGFIFTKGGRLVDKKILVKPVI
ncbi:hypothetical protein EST38_g4642, partial [Candolleomyces aberdarensis]